MRPYLKFTQKKRWAATTWTIFSTTGCPLFLLSTHITFIQHFGVSTFPFPPLLDIFLSWKTSTFTLPMTWNDSNECETTQTTQSLTIPPLNLLAPARPSRMHTVARKRTISSINSSKNWIVSENLTTFPRLINRLNSWEWRAADHNSRYTVGHPICYRL